MPIPFRFLAIAVVLILAAGCSSSDDNTAQDATPRSDEELAIAWWEWATSEPDATNPVVDDTGEHCALNQPSDVWFLANTLGTDVTRSCTVPQTELFLPIVTALCGANGSCTTQYDEAEFEVFLDGEPVTAVEIDTSPGEITMEPGNPENPEGGIFRVVAAGWWVRLPVLDPGEHVLTFSGSSEDDFALSVHYDLVVTG